MAKQKPSKGVQSGQHVAKGLERRDAESGVTVRDLSVAHAEENDPPSSRGFRIAMWIWTVGFVLMVLFELVTTIIS